MIWLVLVACAPTTLISESAETGGAPTPSQQDEWVATELRCDDQYAFTYVIEFDVGAVPGVNFPRFGVWSHVSHEYAREYDMELDTWAFNNGGSGFASDGATGVTCLWMDYGQTGGHMYDRFVVLSEP